MKQFVITPSMGKRLIGKAVAVHPAVRKALAKGTLVIIAGTTNGYVAEELLTALGQADGFTRQGFRRGAVMPPGFDVASVAHEFPGDVVVTDGVWQKGKEIFDVADDLVEGDVILKGANAVDVRRGHAAVYIGHPKAGTIGAALQAVVGRRVQLIVPVGLEKRVLGNVTDLANELNAADSQGPRMLPMPGQAFTELDAIALLTGAGARLLAGGGIYGAEGCVWVGVRGDAEQIDAATQLVQSVAGEPLCQV